MPTKNKLVYLQPAQQDFEEIVKYHIVKSGTTAARTIAAKMEAGIQKLELFPLMGQTHPDSFLAAFGFRKLVLTSTYVAIYKIIDETIYIYRIVNAKTDYPRLLR